MTDDAIGLEAKELLTTLAGIKRMLQDRAIELRRLSGVTEVYTRVEPTSYQSGARLEGYLDVLLEGGKGVCWSFDVRWDNEFWTIDAALSRQLPTGQETVRELLSVRVRCFSEFLDAIKISVSEILTWRIEEAGYPGFGR